MGQYKIEIKPSILPDSKDKKDLVLMAVGKHESSRQGECLSLRTDYYVTVIDDEGLRCAGQILHVDVSFEGRYKIMLGHPDGALREVADEELSGLTFEFVSTKVTL